MKKFTLMMAFLMMFAFGFGVAGDFNYAEAVNLQQEIKSINNGNGTGQMNDAKSKLRGLGKDGLDIVGIVVMTLVLISGIWVAVKFTGAGDNPQQKMILKGALIAHILGLVFLANYFGLVNFLFNSTKVF